MYSKFYSPNIIATGSSEIDQSSYSHHADSDVGVAVIDRYTYYNLDFLEQAVRDQTSRQTLGDLFGSYDEVVIHSRPGFRWDLFEGGEEAGRKRLVMDFFGNVQNVEVDAAAASFNVTAWKEDIAALERLVSIAEEVGNETTAVLLAESSPPAASVDAADLERFAGAMEVVERNEFWSKQAMGIAVLIGGISIWVGGSMFSV